jgi:hypothetical protein
MAEPDSSNPLLTQCVEVDDNDQNILSVSIEKGDEPIGLYYCAKGYHDDDCNDDNLVFTYPIEKEDIGKSITVRSRHSQVR